MISTVRARPNHYEVLSVSPTATDDEIARAFAREINVLRPRAFGGLTEVSIAYETLRDPIKRRAYDAALGLKPEPQPRYAATARWAGTPFIGAALARPTDDRAAAEVEPPAEPRTASFIAASLRDPVGPQPEPEAKPRAEPERSPHAEELRLGDAEDRPVEWSRTAMLGAALVGAVVFLGALAGWQAGKGEQQPQAVTAALPPPKPRPATASPAPAPRVAEARPLRIARAAAAPARIKHSSAPPTASLSEDPLAAQPEPNRIAETATEPATTAESPAVETAAAMPLSNAVIARTIERIGYACGQVSSTSAVEGARGVYTVTCTSGAFYQAKPVRGRYHFRRLGSH